MSARSTPCLLLAALVFLLRAAGVQAQAEGVATRPLVELNTTMGRMVLALYNETPRHRDHFLQLVRAHHYDSTLLHRVVPGAMVQGGDPETRRGNDRHRVFGMGSQGGTLAPEIRDDLIHLKGTVGMERDPSQPGSERRSHNSFFYIVAGQEWSPSELRMVEQRRNAAHPGEEFRYTPEQLKRYATDGGAPRMDGEYTVFGRIVEGLDVLDRITALPCDERDRPHTDVRIWMRELP